MKTITVWQPWAGALAAGIKEYETRSWATKYRGPLAIHAAMKGVFDGLELIPVPTALKIKEALLLRHKGRDNWNRPVYEDETGKLWKDVEPRADRGPKLCSTLYNAFDGEPAECMSKHDGVPVVFLPERDTW